MESNVIGWPVVISQGIDLRVHEPLQELQPGASIDALLQHKVWGKYLSINCFFTNMETGSNFRITVYRQKADNQYRSVVGTLDFKTCPLLCVYRLELGINGKNKVYLKDCSRL